MFDLVGENALVRKTDEAIKIQLQMNDGTNLAVGTHTFYLTIRRTIPATTVNVDTGSDVLYHSSQTVNVVANTAQVTVAFVLGQDILNIEPATYYYDIKYNDPTNRTTSITNGYALVQIKADVTRSNV